MRIVTMFSRFILLMLFTVGAHAAGLQNCGPGMWRDGHGRCNPYAKPARTMPVMNGQTMTIPAFCPANYYLDADGKRCWLNGTDESK